MNPMTMTTPSDTPKSRISQADVFVRQANVVLSVIESMKLPGPLPEAERRRQRSLARRVTPAFLEAVAAASEASGGSVAGVAFDPDLARETIAYLAASDVLITALESVLVALSDERSSEEPAREPRAGHLHHAGSPAARPRGTLVPRSPAHDARGTSAPAQVAQVGGAGGHAAPGQGRQGRRQRRAGLSRLRHAG